MQPYILSIYRILTENSHGGSSSMKININHLQTTYVLPVKIHLDIPSPLGRTELHQALPPDPGNKLTKIPVE